MMFISFFYHFRVRLVTDQSNSILEVALGDCLQNSLLLQLRCRALTCIANNRDLYVMFWSQSSKCLQGIRNSFLFSKRTGDQHAERPTGFPLSRSKG